MFYSKSFVIILVIKKFTVFYNNEHGSWYPKAILIVTSKLTDHRTRNRYNNNEKVWNIVRVIKMRHRDTQWQICWEVGADRLTWCRVATDLQFVKKKKKKQLSVKYNEAECNKRGVSMNSYKYNKNFMLIISVWQIQLLLFGTFWNFGRWGISLTHSWLNL